MNEKHESDALHVRWDLRCFYKGVDDPQFDRDVQEWADRAKAFHAAHKGHLADTLPQALRDWIALEALGAKVTKYLLLLQSLDTGNAVVKAKRSEFQKVTSTTTADFLKFFEHEAGEIDETVFLAHAAKDPLVAKHLPWLRTKRIFKPHLLPESIEAALTTRDPFGCKSWSEFYSELEADLRFDWEGEKVTLEKMLDLLGVEMNPSVRAAALKTTNDGLSGIFAKYAAETLWMVVGSKEVETRERGYKHPMHARNKISGLSDAVVDALHKTVVEEGGAQARRYYRLKAKILGIPVLAWSDRNAPMPFTDTTAISWDTAMETVLAAYRSFSPTLAHLIEEMVARQHIDAPPAQGKQAGAFNESTVLPDGTPVSLSLLNFFGSSDSIVTLAHELGHGVHGILAGEAQGILMWEASIALSETASVFGEMLAFRHLKQQLAKKDERLQMLALLMDKIDGLMGTVVRQIGFSNFERRLHGWDEASGQWKGSRRLSVEELDQLWLATTQEIYGKHGDVFTYENAHHLWAYVPHFHDPFYVYGYAFGELLVHSLLAARPRLGSHFEPLYLDLLRAGGSKNAVELLAPFGLNPEDPQFWADGIAASMEAMIGEAEEIAWDLGFVLCFDE